VFGKSAFKGNFQMIGLVEKFQISDGLLGSIQ